MRRAVIVSIGLGFLAVPTGAFAGDPITIHALHRTSKLIVGYVNQIAPRAPETEVVLVLKLKGIGLEEFKAYDEGDIFVMAGDRRCASAFRQSSGTVTVQSKDRSKPPRTYGPQLLVALIVPKDTREMDLVVGTHPPTRFVAPAEISEALHDSAVELVE